ncbi:MAG: DUF1080 domain-containing protein, partial [Cyclobacteriaceae bacterium]|nr:DUF1080 domain-containing protein [Cyclobacteriaceae bacterium]
MKLNNKYSTMLSKMKYSSLVVVLLAMGLTNCGTKQNSTGGTTAEEATVQVEVTANSENTLTEQEVADGWKLLFDGKQTTGWRGYNQETLPKAWIVEDGTLKSLGEGG